MHWWFKYSLMAEGETSETTKAGKWPKLDGKEWCSSSFFRIFCNEVESLWGFFIIQYRYIHFWATWTIALNAEIGSQRMNRLVWMVDDSQHWRTMKDSEHALWREDYRMRSNRMVSKRDLKYCSYLSKDLRNDGWFESRARSQQMSLADDLTIFLPHSYYSFQ